MKGLIFTEFIEMVEDRMGFELANSIIEDAKLPSEGIYTAVGTYPESEMIALLIQLSQKTNTSIPDLLEVFGEHLFSRFAKIYPYMFEGKNSTFEFLQPIEPYIPVEVLQLYPDALLPTLEIIPVSDNQMTMIYRSPRKLSNLAIGLMRGCSKHFNEALEISISKMEDEGAKVWFEIRKK